MKRVWATAITIVSGGVIASCATLLGAGGDYELTGSSTSAGGAGVSTASSSAGTGGDPATTVSVAVSSSSDSSSSTGGAGGSVVVPPSWHLFSFDMQAGTWSSALLQDVWVGPNAPPSTGIIATCHLDHFDKLLVFTDAGMLHIRDSGVWLAPVLAQSVFPEITHPAKIADLYHVPSDWNVTPMAMPLKEGLVISDSPTYWLYDFNSDNTATFGKQDILAPPMQPAEPPQSTVKVQWYFTIWNKSKIGTGDGYAGWGAFGDGYVYRLGADNVWAKWPIDSIPAPLWGGKPGAPVWSTLTAAYFLGPTTTGIGTVVFIGP